MRHDLHYFLLGSEIDSSVNRKLSDPVFLKRSEIDGAI